MKRRLAAGMILLVAYPTAAVVLILLERNSLLASSMSLTMSVRFLAGLASFCGLAILTGEYQARKQMRRMGKT